MLKEAGNTIKRDTSSFHRFRKSFW